MSEQTKTSHEIAAEILNSYTPLEVSQILLERFAYVQLTDEFQNKTNIEKANDGLLYNSIISLLDAHQKELSDQLTLESSSAALEQLEVS